MKRTMTLTANMGSCQCGDIYTEVLIDEDNGVIITEPQDPKWMQGFFLRDEFHVPYCRNTGLLQRDFKHIVRKFTDSERGLFNNKG